MCIDLLTNPTVIGAIIGAIVGAVTSTAFAMGISYYKFNKRKNGAKALIKSEINYMINTFEKFRDENIKDKITLDNESEMNNEVFYFYNTISDFPGWNNRNWINLFAYIPSIFGIKEIDKINQFYAECEEITYNAKFLSKKSNFITWTSPGEEPTYASIPQETINEDRNNFRDDLNHLIEFGKEVKKTLK